MVSVASAIYINSLMAEVDIIRNEFFDNSAIVMIIRAIYGFFFIKHFQISNIKLI